MKVLGLWKYIFLENCLLLFKKKLDRKLLVKDQLLLTLKTDCERQVFLPFLLPFGGMKENKKIFMIKALLGFYKYSRGRGFQGPQEHFHFLVKSFLKDKWGWINPLKGKENWEISKKEISWVWVNQAKLKLFHVYFKHCFSVYILFLWSGSLSVGGWYLFDVA